MKEEWLFPGAVVPVDMETTAALVAEIKRLIDVVGGMALAQAEQEYQRGYADAMGWKVQNHLEHLPPAQPEQDATMQSLKDLWREVCDNVGKQYFAQPPQRTWVGLTYEDMTKLQKDLYNAKGESVLPTTFAMAVEAKLKEKNNDR
jgi:hypothetical protein